jgi:hypothetical protein
MSGSVFMPTTISPTTADIDPNKHVNYVLGMVLGVDDFNQEFGYLAGRDQLAAREIGGYGVVRGLRVSTLTDANKGPEIVVSAGTAIMPDGRFVKVPLTQCAVLNDWIANNRAALTAAGIVPTLGPPAKPAQATLYVLLSYAERATDLVPIPGEPCRTEEESMAESRIADDFRLELSLVPPEQRERDAIRQYIAWLTTKLTMVDTGAPSLPDFLASIEKAAAAAPKLAPGGKPLAPGAPIFEPAGFGASIPRASAALYIAEALRLFPTLRAEWQGLGGKADGTPPNEDRLLLAQVSVTIEISALDSSKWVVQSPQPAPALPPVLIDETKGAHLLPLAYLQEAVLALVERTSAAVGHPLAPAGLRYLLVAAGTVTIKPANDPSQPLPTYNGLTAIATGPGTVQVAFIAPSGGANLQYVVKALPMAEPEAVAPEFINPSVSLASVPTTPDATTVSFTLRIVNTNKSNVTTPVAQATLVGRKLMIEVSAFG